MSASHKATDPLAVEVLDRSVRWCFPVGVVAIVAGVLGVGRDLGNWVWFAHLGLLCLAGAVSLARSRIGAAWRLAIYSMCFVGAAAAETVVFGVAGGGVLLSFIAVLLGAVERRRVMRWAIVALAVVALGTGLSLHAVGVFSLPDAAAYLAAPWTAVSGMLLFGIACVGVVYWRELGVRLHRNNEKLQLAGEHFRMMFEGAGDAALILEEGRILQANAQAEITFGYSLAEMRSLPLEALSPAHQSDGSDSASGVARLLEASCSAPQRYRWMHRRKDGRLFEAEVSLNCSLHRERRIFLALARDLSDYRIVERENRLLATALNHAGEAVAITDAEGHLVYVNRAFEQITGYSRLEVHGSNLRILKSGKHDEAFYRELWTTILAGRAWRGRLQNRRKDGTFYTEDCTITPLRDERSAIQHFVAVKRDVSHELELETQLMQSRKMEAIGRLAGGIAHDFNNILQVINGNVALAELDAPVGHPVHTSLDEIAKAGERAVNLVQQLLAFSRREELKVGPVDLGQLISDTARMLRRLLGEDITLVVPPVSRPLYALADPGRVEQVLLNLCVNSRDALLDGGRITIETETIRIDEAYSELHPDSKPGDYVVVAVSDDGCGIPKEIQHRIFEPFFSTKEVGRGTGLGLATVYAIVRQHGGFINLYSEVGLGSTFRFYLPVAQQAPEATPCAPAADAAALHGRGETVLIAEDDDQVLAIAHRVLAQAGYRVLTARHGDEALAVYIAHQGPIHLALLDVVMPHRNGRLTYDELRRRDPLLPVLFATGYSYHHLQDGLIEEEKVLRKPFTPHELLSRVRRAIDARAAVRAN